MTKEEFRITVFSLSERLFPMVRRLLEDPTNAEDAIQEIMLKLWEKRSQLKHHPNITGLVFLTARNHCIDLIRKNRIKTDTSPYSLEQLSSSHGQEQTEWKELQRIIETILQDLPEQQSEVLKMRDLDGYEFTEIAAALQLKVEHVRVLLSRARKQVSIKLEKIYSYEGR